VGSTILDPSVFGDPFSLSGDFLDPSIPPLDPGYVDPGSTTGTNVLDQIPGTSNAGIDGINNCDGTISVMLACGDGSTVPSDPFVLNGPSNQINGPSQCVDPISGVSVVCPDGVLASDGVVGTTPSGTGGPQGNCLPGGLTGPSDPSGPGVPCTNVTTNPALANSGTSSAGAVGALGSFLGNLLRGITGGGTLGSGVIPACGSGFSTTGLCRGSNGTLYKQGTNGQLVAVSGPTTSAGFLGNSSIIVVGGILVLLFVMKAKGKL
jgi:hypothetical protein